MRPAASFFCLLMAACSANKAPATLENGDTVRIAEIIKGDELVLEKAGKKATARVLGLYAFAPVMEDPTIVELAQTTLSWTKERFLDQHVAVSLEAKEQDSHGRYLVYLSPKDTEQSFSQQLLEEGQAIVYTEYTFENEQQYLGWEGKGRQASRGIWSKPEGEKLARGLRQQWQQARKRLGSAPLNDPLLAPSNEKEAQ